MEVCTASSVISDHHFHRLLESYREFLSPASRKAIERTRPPTTLRIPLPVTFPESYPFSLIALLPEALKVIPGTSITRENEAIFYPGLGETAIVLLVLILSSPKKHILNFLESSLEIEGREKFFVLLSQFFKVAISILENDAFPKTWLNVNILAHKVLVRMMDPIATIMEREFLPTEESEAQFDPHLWRDAFYTLLKLLSSDQLVIEEFSPQVDELSCMFGWTPTNLVVRNVEPSGGLLVIYVVTVLQSCILSGKPSVGPVKSPAIARPRLDMEYVILGILSPRSSDKDSVGIPNLP